MVQAQSGLLTARTADHVKEETILIIGSLWYTIRPHMIGGSGEKRDQQLPR